MFASQKEPARSPSYEEEDAETESCSPTLAPSHFSRNRLRVICSRRNEQATVKNIDRVKEAAPSRKPGPRIFFA
jgi:hypothetical protein